MSPELQKWILGLMSAGVIGLVVTVFKMYAKVAVLEERITTLRTDYTAFVGTFEEDDI